MKRVIVFGIVAMMVMGLAVTASAAVDTTWMAQLRASTGTPLLGIGNLTLGTKVGATDAYLFPEDAAFAPPTGTPGVIISNIVPGQLTSKDVRAPFMTGDTKVWDLSMYIAGGAAGQVTLTGWMATGVNMLDLSTGGDPNVLVQLFQVGNPTALWTVPYGVSGSQALPTFTQSWTLDKGQVVSLQLVASASNGVITPEPGSMLAMLSGLIGLVGFGIRRRK